MSCAPNYNDQLFQELLFEDNTAKVDTNNNTDFDFTEVLQSLTASCSNNKINYHSSSSNSIEHIDSSIANMEDSPIMNTPFLDHSCINTPFTPNAILFTPNINHQLHSSPYYSPYINTSLNVLDNTAQLDDIQVANYIKNDTSWHDNAMSACCTPAIAPSMMQTPVMTTTSLFGTLDNNFNVQSQQVLLNATNNNNGISSVMEGSSDTLFPPLPSNHSQQDIKYDFDSNTNPSDLLNPEDISVDNLFNNDILIMNQQHQVNKSVAPLVAPSAKKAIKKRKEIDEATHEFNKRMKLSINIIKKKPIDAQEKRYECDTCHLTFNRRYNRDTHMKTHDKNRMKAFACEVCSKPFDRKHDLTRHVSSVHNGERAYRCNECPSSFSRKDALMRHCMQRH